MTTLFTFTIASVGIFIASVLLTIVVLNLIDTVYDIKFNLELIEEFPDVKIEDLSLKNSKRFNVKAAFFISRFIKS
jgi:uncharacterized protein YsxB (DUF464 family)